MSLPANYDVEEAARLLRWVALYKNWPGLEESEIQNPLRHIVKFLDAICPTCHGAGDYFIAEDEREPCDDCGMWMRPDFGTTVTTEAF